MTIKILFTSFSYYYIFFSYYGTNKPGDQISWGSWPAWIQYSIGGLLAAAPEDAEEAEGVEADAQRRHAHQVPHEVRRAEAEVVQDLRAVVQTLAARHHGAV